MAVASGWQQSRVPVRAQQQLFSDGVGTCPSPGDKEPNQAAPAAAGPAETGQAAGSLPPLVPLSLTGILILANNLVC